MHSIHCVPQELMSILLAPIAEVLGNPFELVEDTNGLDDVARVGKNLGDVILHSAHHTETGLVTCFGMLSRQHVVCQWRGVGEALQGRVEEAGVAQVLEARSDALRLAPFQTDTLHGE